MSLALFQEAEHQPFRLAGGAPAALLVHGFPGTPAEMRPLAEALKGGGWTAQALLLPGFGPQITTLFERRADEWIGAVTEGLRALAREHQPVLLVGYSLGGALALHAARAAPPAGLVLLAPYWHLHTSWTQRLIFAVVRRFVPYFRPFDRADFSDARLRQGLARMLPGLPLDDLAVQNRLRSLRVPAALLDELQRVFRGAIAAAGQWQGPTLVVQGEEDETTHPDDTRQLHARLPGPSQYVAVPGGHALVDPRQPGWAAVRQAVLDFAGMIQAGATPDGQQD